MHVKSLAGFWSGVEAEGLIEDRMSDAAAKTDAVRFPRQNEKALPARAFGRRRGEKGRPRRPQRTHGRARGAWSA